MDVREVVGGFEFSERFTLDVIVSHRPHEDFTIVLVNGRKYVYVNSTSVPLACSSAISSYVKYDSDLNSRLDRMVNADLPSRKG